MYKRSIGGWAKHWDFILLDTICLQLSYFLAYFYRFNSWGVYIVEGNHTTYRTSGIVMLFLSIVIAIFFNTMHNVLQRGFWEEAKSTIIQCSLVLAAIVVLIFTDKASDNISRIVVYITIGLYMIISYITRLIYKQILIAQKKNIKPRELLLVGDEKGIEKALAAFETHPEAGINVGKIVRVDKEDLTVAMEYIRNEYVTEVYVACLDSALVPHNLIRACSEMAVTIHQQMFMDEEVKGRQWIEKIAKQPVLTNSISIPRPRALLVKRLIDIIAGMFMSLIALIVLLIVAPIIKKASPGPVLLKLERIGLNGKKFKMFQIRTMYMDAGSREDKIIKGIGQKLRDLGLDDLPKGFNILLGQMSLVGTRAPSIEEWKNYEFRHRARLACKPGITGLWQASGKSKIMSFEEATALDTDYIMNWSLGLDWRILFKTVALRK